MKHFFWNPLSINYLIELVLTAIIAGYFVYRLFAHRNTWQETRSTGFMAMAMLGATGSTSLQLLSNSLHPFYGNLVLPWVGPAGAIGMTGFLLFSYYFLSPSGLGKRGGIILAFLLAALVSMELAIAAKRWELAQAGIVEFREAWVDIPFAAGFGFSFLFLAAHLTRALRKELHVPLRSGLWRALLAIAWPPTKLNGDAAAARAFFYVSAMPLLLGLSLLLRSYGLIDWLWAEVLACWFFLLAVAGFTLTYLNFVPEQTSFRIKVIGVTLITMLSILCGVSWIVGSVYIDEFENEYLPADQTTLRFAPNDSGGYSISQTDYMFQADVGRKISSSPDGVELPFAFPFFERSYNKAYVSQTGVVGFDHLPLWREFGNRFGPQAAIFAMTVSLIEDPRHEQGTDSGLYFSQQRNHVTFTWNNLVSLYQPQAKFTFQVRMYRTGAIDLVYKELPQELKPDVYRVDVSPMMMGIVPAFFEGDVAPVRFSNDLPVETSGNQGAIEYHRLDFLAYLDRIYAPIALFVLASSLAILFIFPRFFHLNLDLPLKKLITAVQQIIDGKLATEIGVVHRDEIGFLAASFKTMAKAQHDLIQTLEEKVALRTSEVAEYAAKNARLEERNRLSRDLHDAVSQTLFSANLIASTLPDLMENDPKNGRFALDDIQRLNKEALAEMRQMLLDLRPEKFGTAPLGILLQNLIGDIERKFPVDISLQIEGDAVLPDAVQLTLYRIAQESLTNAAKHSQTTKMSVVFDGLQTQAMLSVSDNGLGFDSRPERPGHLGLNIMQERIREIGGTLEIETTPGAGTTVTAIWFASDNDPVPESTAAG